MDNAVVVALPEALAGYRRKISWMSAMQDDVLREKVMAFICELRALAYRNRARRHNHLTWQAIALEQEKCADELEAILTPAPTQESS